MDEFKKKEIGALEKFLEEKIEEDKEKGKKKKEDVKNLKNKKNIRRPIKPRFTDPEPRGPPLGTYNPKLISKSQKIMRNYDRETKKVDKRKKKINEKLKYFDIEKYYKDQNPDKPKKNLKGFVSMDRMTKRKKLVQKEIFDAEGKQFIYRDIPKNSTKFRPISSFSIKKSKFDSRSTMFSGKEELPNYHPNFEYGLKRTWNGVPVFELTCGRDFSDKRPATLNEKFYDYNKYKEGNKSQIWKRVSAPNLKKMEGRKPLVPSYNVHLFPKGDLEKKRPKTALIKPKNQKRNRPFSSISKKSINPRERPFSSNPNVKNKN